MNTPRSVTPLDLPLVRRVISQSLPLDMTAALTRGINGMEDALLSSVPLADLGAPTMILRNGEGTLVGQFRHRMGDSSAQLTFLAPEPHDGVSRDWARLLEAMIIEAGKRGAHSISAELAENHPAFAIFRMAGFAVYSRQVILKREPGPLAAGDPTLVRPELERDSFAINALYANTVPRLLQIAEPLPGADCCGFVYERDGQIAGYLAVLEGKSGVIIKPYFHPEAYEQAAEIVLSALTYLPRVERLPVYLYARAYQDWLRGALEQVEFEACTHQALMVKYTVIRTERAEALALPGLEPNRLHPPVVDGPMSFKFLSRDSWLSLWRRYGRKTNKNSKHYGTSNHR
jgi:hypothetical protein